MDALDELVAYIESRHRCIEGLPTFRCQTGEPYVLVGIPTQPDASQPAGTIAPIGRGRWSASAPAALLTARTAYNQYAHGRRGTLYWRTKPQMRMRLNRLWCVYMRLLISEAPAIEAEAAACDAWHAGRPPAPEERTDAR